MGEVQIIIIMERWGGGWFIEFGTGGAMGGEDDFNDPLHKKGDFGMANTVVLLDVQNGY